MIYAIPSDSSIIGKTLLETLEKLLPMQDQQAIKDWIITGKVLINGDVCKDKETVLEKTKGNKLPTLKTPMGEIGFTLAEWE